MNPHEIGESYDMIAHRWATPAQVLDGLPQHVRAMQFLKTRGAALDVGCGCNGRLIDYLQSERLTVEGIDISEEMVALARRRDPALPIHHADICTWALPRMYDFISAWDSIWHVPLAMQEGVLQKLCAGLATGGVLIFTVGGLDQPDEVRDSHMGPPMYTATQGIPRTLAQLPRNGCVCRHLEYDQYPEPHVYVIAQKV